MNAIIVNPGSGPVANATEQNAVVNIRQFVKDCEEASGCAGIAWQRDPKGDEDGRYCFYLTRGKAQHVVDMPGLPLEQVRYLGQKEQNIWHFPRLYVDGASWVWKYAILKRKENWLPDKDGTVES